MSAPKQTGWARIVDGVNRPRRVPAYGRTRHFVITPCQMLSMTGTFTVTHSGTGYIAVNGVPIGVARRAMAALEKVKGVRWSFRDAEKFTPDMAAIAKPIAKKYEAMR